MTNQTTATPADLWPFQLCRGHSKSPPQGACLLDAVSWFEDGCLNDRPKCVSPVLAGLGHWCNDMSTDGERQSLRRFIPLLVGTNTGERDDELRAGFLIFGFRELTSRWKRPLEKLVEFREDRFWEYVERIRRRQSAIEAAKSVLSYAVDLYQRSRGLTGNYIMTSSVTAFGLYDGNQKNLYPLPPQMEIDYRQLDLDLMAWAIGALEVGCAIGRQADGPGFDWRAAPAKVEAFRQAALVNE